MNNTATTPNPSKVHVNPKQQTKSNQDRDTKEISQTHIYTQHSAPIPPIIRHIVRMRPSLFSSRQWPLPHTRPCPGRNAPFVAPRRENHFTPHPRPRSIFKQIRSRFRSRRPTRNPTPTRIATRLRSSPRDRLPRRHTSREPRTRSACRAHPRTRPGIETQNARTRPGGRTHPRT